MRRREFIALLGAAVACPFAARAQQGERVRRIGVLMAYAEDDLETKLRFAAFRQGLESLGWSEGSNVRIDCRYSPAATVDQAQGAREGAS
jgi:putative tryptophan/tyrosine transport system substrate-binding protein